MLLGAIVRIVGPNHALEVFGIKLVGVNAENGIKLLFTVLLFVVLLFLSKLARQLARGATRSGERSAFWVRQGIGLGTTIVLLIGTASIWFDDPTRLTTALGLVTAGLAFALQRVVTALAGYFVILRGSTFNVGDRIVMGGVRGDVIALGFLQTTIMEMGQPPPVQNAAPAMWVKARQYTGRIVTVSNAKIFEDAVFNYTRNFSYVWEELSIYIAYRDDWQAVEKLMLDAAMKHTVQVSKLAEQDIRKIEERFAVQRSGIEPKVYVRMTENWIELTVRFVAGDHGARDIKDAMARDLLPALKAAKIEIASGTYEITGLPPIRVQMANQVQHAAHDKT